MWFGEKHQEALATLRYGILDNKGFLLLTGDVGTGKTSLINSLIQSLSDNIICATVPDPSLEKLDFLNYIAAAFGIDREFQSKGSFLAFFRNFLSQASERGKKVLLIVDESQLLTQEMLEEIRLLSNIERTDAKLINIFFIGQNEFNEILNRPQNRAVRQRLTLNYNLDPLTPDETHAYIRHRLKVAGTTETLFDMSAVQEVFMYSGGFPRRINILCDHALLSGYVKEQKVIDGAIVKECAKELKIPAHVRNRDINGFAHAHQRPAPAPDQSPAGIPSVRPPVAPPAVPPTPSPAEPPSAPYSGPPSSQVPRPGYQPYPEEPRKSRLSWIGWILVIILLGLFAWAFMFPENFRQSTRQIGVDFPIIGQTVEFLFPSTLHNDTRGQVHGAVPSPQPPLPSTPPLNEGAKATADASEAEPPSAGVAPGESQNNPAVESKNKDAGPEIPTENQPDDAKSQEADISPPLEDTDSKTLGNKDQASLLEPATSLVTMDSGPTSEGSQDILPLPAEKVIVRFKYNSNDFTDKGIEDLETFSSILAMYPEAKVLVTGHTDSMGYENYNKKLSEFRANIVKSYLMGKGIRQDQIKTRGLGGEKPIETNDTPWGKMMNRRVEIEILK